MDTRRVQSGGVKKRSHRRHSPDFKAHVVEAWVEPGCPGLPWPIN